MSVIFVVVLPCLIAAVIFISTRWRSSKSAKEVQEQQQKCPPVQIDVCFPSEPPGTTRFGCGYGGGGVVYGYPSSGGIYSLHDCFSVELEFLGFDRFHPPELRSESLDEEDAHCERMRQLGATWWKVLGIQEWDEYFRVGWPAGGGAWVLRTTVGKAGEKGAGMMHNAHNMEERCRIIEQMGGVFYANPDDCLDLYLR